MERPFFSLITINYNQRNFTKQFLQSVKGLIYPHFEVILIDNGSTKDPCEDLADFLPNIIYLKSLDNLGFAGGNNLGIKAAKGDYLFFLNNDTQLPADFLSTLVPFIKAQPDLGMLSPKVIFPNGIIQYAGGKNINPITGRGKRIGLMEPDNRQYDYIKETDLCHGAALLVPQIVIKKVGGMPENFFLYYEEHDWTQQIRKAGFKIFYYGKTKIVHHESISIGKLNPIKTYYLTRNRILYMRRNHPGFRFYVYILFFLLFTLPKNTLKYLLTKEKSNLYHFYKGIFWHLSQSKNVSL